jgi:hypothetical protein
VGVMSREHLIFIWPPAYNVQAVTGKAEPE